MSGDPVTGPGDDRLSAGRVGKAHGLDGSFYVTRPRAGVLENGLLVRIAGEDVRLRRCAGTDDRPILALEGVNNRSGVEALRGEDLWVTRADIPALDPDEWLAEDLEGCVVADGPVAVGRVRRLLGLPSCDVLEVERAAGGADLLVPLVRDAIRSIDVAGARIEINLRFLGEESAPAAEEDEES